MKALPRTKPHKASPSSQTVPKQLLVLLEEHIPGFKDEKYAFEIAWLLWCGVDPAREHREYDNAIWMHTDELKRLFGQVKHFTDANRGPAQRYFFTLRHLNGVSSGKDAYTNGYQPKPWMQKALNWIIHGAESIDLVDKSGRGQRLERSAVSSLDTHGHAVRRWKGVNVPALIPVNIENLQSLATKWERLLALKSNHQAFEAMLTSRDFNEQGIRRAYAQTKVLITQAQGSRHTGMLPVRYVLHESGRLYANGLNLQTCKREIRQAALAGFWDVDISACHPSIMAQMAKRFGQQCPSIEDYIARKKIWREQIAHDIGIPPKMVKKALNAVGYGAPRSTSPYNEIPHQIGPIKAAAFFAHPLCQGFKADVDAATAAILAKHPRKNKRLDNLANRGMAVKTPEGENIKPSTLMSHLLQGVEAAALEAAIRACDGKVLLLQHDGFTATEFIDPNMLEQKVLEATGYDLTFEVEQIQIPMADIEGQKALNKKLETPLQASIHAGLGPFWPCFWGTIPFGRGDVPPVFPVPLPSGDLPF